MVTSRYAELVAPGEMAVKQEELSVGEGQVLVKITHCGLCQYDGVYFKSVIGEPPQRLGHEPVGIIEAVGRGVDGYKEGDRVTGLFAFLKAFAEYGLAEPDELIKVPEHVKSEHALIEPLKCISTILRTAPPEFGDHVLVMGCGFMGLLVISGLVGAAPASIIAVDIQEDRLKLAKEFGATHTLNSLDNDFLDQVKDITDGRGTDVVFEVTSHPEAVELAAKTLRKGRGRYALAGWHGKPGTYTLRNWTTRGAIIYSAHPSFSLDQLDDMRRAMDGLARGVFPMDKLVTHTFTLDEIQTAFETMTTGVDGYIKGVVTL